MTHTHFIGIGGSGLSAIARVLLERGEKVTGSDREYTVMAEALEEAGAKVFVGHNGENITGADLAIRSSAVADDNVEVLAAREVGIPVLRREEYLGQLLDNQKVVAVAGSHGKTTVTSMIAWMLTALHQKPSFISGGIIENLGVNAHAGEGPLFVIEADEYDHMFLGLEPSIAIVTNVEHDHPDFFPTPEKFTQAFRDFVARLKPGGTLAVCLDDEGAAALLAENSLEGKNRLTYGISKDAEYQARNLHAEGRSGFQFDLYRGDHLLTAVALQVPGRHNVLNALAALIVADLQGLAMDEAALALGEFRGADRRFDVAGEIDGVTVIDDYAHHPTEIRATLDAARERYPGRYIWALWQPHTYSRTSQLLPGYKTAFEDADGVVVTPVYAARETRPDGFSQRQVVDAIEHQEIHLANGLTEAGDFLLSQVERGDVVLVLSAGDAVELSVRLLSELSEMEKQYA